MGDLDEAIREHLDLKRRRGADPEEVARQEQEALSPVTRSHAIVSAPAAAPEPPARAPEPPARAPEPPAPHEPTSHASHDPLDEPPAPPAEFGDETQEFRIDHSADDWLDDDEDDGRRA